jgi:hypothetical protein
VGWLAARWAGWETRAAAVVETLVCNTQIYCITFTPHALELPDCGGNAQQRGLFRLAEPGNVTHCVPASWRQNEPVLYLYSTLPV